MVESNNRGGKKQKEHQGHNKEGMPITEGTHGKAKAPSTAHLEQQGHQKNAEIIRTPTAKELRHQQDRQQQLIHQH